MRLGVDSLYSGESVRKDFLGRGWKFPFQFDPATGGVALSEYEQNIKECVSIVVGTKLGERQMLPDFGCQIHEMMFAPNTRATATIVARQVDKALGRWEPRIEVEEVQAWPDDAGKIQVQVNYKIRSTLSQEEMFLLMSSGG
jgi:phage baseplate assembly protein W